MLHRMKCLKSNQRMFSGLDCRLCQNSCWDVTDLFLDWIPKKSCQGTDVMKQIAIKNTYNNRHALILHMHPLAEFPWLFSHTIKKAIWWETVKSFIFINFLFHVPWLVCFLCIINYLLVDCCLLKKLGAWGYVATHPSPWMVALKQHLMFFNKVQEEHVQIINLINTKGAQSVINPVNKVRGVYIHSILTSVPWQFSSILPLPLLRTYNYLFLKPPGGGGGTLGSGQSSELEALPSDSTPNTHNIYSIY